MEINVARDRTDFGPESSDLVGEHARSGNLDCIVPVVVVVAQCVGKVQNCHLTDVRGILCNVEMGGFDTSLGD